MPTFDQPQPDLTQDEATAIILGTLHGARLLTFARSLDEIMNTWGWGQVTIVIRDGRVTLVRTERNED